MSRETCEKVSRASKEIGYVRSSAAASLATGKSQNFAVVTPFINRWFYSELIHSVESQLIESGYDLTLYLLSNNWERRAELFDYFLVRKGVDAVITLTLFLKGDEVSRLQKLGKPIVGIGGQVPGIATFSIDDFGTASQATSHLIQLGHKKIAHIGGDQETQPDFKVHSNRLKGFREALEVAGLSHDNDFYGDDFDISGGYRSALKALSDPSNRPTGIVAGSDEIAIGVIIAAKELGVQVPHELSIIGIDGHPLGETFGLTTMHQHVERQGTRAVDQALAELGNSSVAGEKVHYTMPANLHIRSSTARHRD